MLSSVTTITCNSYVIGPTNHNSEHVLMSNGKHNAVVQLYLTLYHHFQHHKLTCHVTVTMTSDCMIFKITITNQ